MVALMLVFIAVGGYVGGEQGMMIAFLMAAVFVFLFLPFFAYLFLFFQRQARSKKI